MSRQPAKVMYTQLFSFVSLCTVLLSTNGWQTTSFIRKPGSWSRCKMTSSHPINLDPSSVRYFINLTNGIEAIPLLQERGIAMDQIHFFRLQSTHCESRNYHAIIENIDYNLLLSLALGYVVVLLDFGCRGSKVSDHRDGIPRSYWWGVEWIKFVLNEIWDLETRGEIPMVRGCNVQKAFQEELKAMPKDLRRKIKYFRPYLRSPRIHLYPVYAKTTKDGDKPYYANLLKTSLEHETKDIHLLETMPRQLVDSYVLQQFVPPHMHIYRSSDFEGFGRNAVSTTTNDDVIDSSTTVATNVVPTISINHETAGE